MLKKRLIKYDCKKEYDILMQIEELLKQLTL